MTTSMIPKATKSGSVPMVDVFGNPSCAKACQWLWELKLVAQVDIALVSIEGPDTMLPAIAWGEQ
jgi:hypothetical protein